MAAAHLPWFGSIADPTVPEKSAVSGDLWRTGLCRTDSCPHEAVCGTQRYRRV
jgi:hypothetical protein